MEKTVHTNNASIRLLRGQRTEARDKTHEQRKPKKKRNMDSETVGQFIPQASRLTEQNSITCYQVTGASYSQPIVPPENVSFPTQVSDQEGSNIDELVFSNGKSIRVDYAAASNRTPIDIQAPNVGTGFVSYTRNPDRQQKSEENYVPSNHWGQNLSKRPLRQPRYPEYTEYDKRLKSFARWWKNHPDSITLCNAGFFYTDKEDLVRCYHCGVGLKDFSDGDNPLNEHVKNSSECPYLQEYLGSEGLASMKRQVQTKDSQHNLEESPNTFAVRHPEYQSYQVRLSSFSRWPQSLLQRPEQLAEAGLYYTGLEDYVRCFACDGGLRKWDPEDDPCIEHCRWFPDCPFVRKQKGDQYIGLVQSTKAIENQKTLGTEEAAAHTSPGNDITGELERLTLKDPELNAVVDEHREACLEMGYSEKDINIALRKLAKEGNIRPTIEDLLDAIESAEQIESEANVHENETPIEKNVRLKSMLFCMTCGVNAVNALFLPCTHHRMCMTCAQRLSQCPICYRHIRQKIKTYLV
ncbi:baculoviral IAP repeat-containing protein 7-B-like isoform X2 [Mercenaria mercenaria]|uniref:baculoviral IAP repeat-containing protein 7-B-like isoform X2 n=1 Tax=Mercenaria mercenaria TaxID=6596 RepID=UPI00234EE717|nr:baculoviral IAP repeat-containing protein 7-B-like isoform X2 [Mercenaria mercenaria]